MVTPSPLPTLVVVMGVAGSGKTTIGRLLASTLGWAFADGDDFHGPTSIAKMASGVPLSDADRIPWLDRIGSWMDEQRSAGHSAVVACSALKRAYRDRLRAGRPSVQLVYLDGDRAIIERHLTQRQGHFFRAQMLASQFADLEVPQSDESPISVSVRGDSTPKGVVSEIVSRLGASARIPR
ncbi:MAG TPA: gluconokinase [Polyangiaceae bacterium]|nr:gluconokinase [Polyangiaceae bacterium]